MQGVHESMEACRSLLPLEPNRVERFYRGGSGIDSWRREKPSGDTFLSEDMMLALVPYIGPGNPSDNGYSHVIYDGRSVRLSTLIESDRRGFLGPEYADDINIPAGISCRVGDSSDERLVIQYHPDDIFARERIGIHFGKTEAWYIAAVRGDSSYCLAGFRNGISKSEFVNAFYDGDSKSIEQMMHRIDFMKGDTILIPAGMIHAMGPETTFLEIHNPCDYTFRLERSIAGRKLKDEEIHYGLGFDALIDGLSFRTYTEEEVMSETVFHPEPIGIYGDIRRFTIIPYSRNASFRIDKLKISGKGTIKGLDCHMLLVAVSNDTMIQSCATEVFLKQGYGVFVPYEASHELTFEGNESEIIVGFPFAI